MLRGASKRRSCLITRLKLRLRIVRFVGGKEEHLQLVRSELRGGIIIRLLILAKKSAKMTDRFSI